jgi:uncharacterized protein
MAKDLKLTVNDLIANKEKTSSLKPENYVTPDIGLLGLKDIIKNSKNQDWILENQPKCFEFDPNVKQ